MQRNITATRREACENRMIVKYHNDLSEISFRNFKASDLDIFMTICMKCANQRDNLVTITDTELAKLSKYGKDMNRFRSSIQELCDKVTDLKLNISNDQGISSMVLFPTFSWDSVKRKCFIQINENFIYILNEFKEGNFTEFELEEFVQLRSVYSRLAYRQLKRFKDTGVWIVKIEDFKELLDIPQSYRMDNITQRILIPIQEELSEYFEDLKIEKITKQNNGKRGRPQTIGFRFTFKKEQHKRMTPKAIPYTCPECGQPLYEIKDKEGHVFYGHKNGHKKNAICRKTFTTIAEIRGLDELPDGKKDDVEPQEDKTISMPNDIRENMYRLLNKSSV